VTAPRSSQRAILLIVTEEDGDQPYYLATEQHFSWPGGASGPTVGVGFDCGYETPGSVSDEWTGFIDAGRIATLQCATGHTSGAAQTWVAEHRYDVTITWAEALAQFGGRELPKWENIVQQHLPNTNLLSGDSFGAIVSLTYNRGPSYDLPGSRYIEMRNIKAHMAAKAFDQIPGEFLAMRRLWPTGGDLWNRRGHEAILFRDGLIPALATTPATT
jgi:GH24 family phage-related lysozyme (muramidase)